MEMLTEFNDSIDRQEELVRTIQEMLELAHQGKSSPEHIRHRVNDLLTRTDSVYTKLLRFGQKVRLPRDPTLFAIGIDPSDVKVFQSKLRPAMLTRRGIA
jgi:phosphatidylinositol 3-kinase